MAKYDFRVLLETVEGVKTSYMSQSFVDTSVDLVLSSSQVYHRITGSVSCSYQNSTIFSGSATPSYWSPSNPNADFNQEYKFKNNNLLSASLSGSNQFGFIQFIASNTQYDRLLRYKFFGGKVCSTLGLPNNQWIYVDQFRLPSDEESNYFQGNVNAQTLNISDVVSFGPTSNVTSHITFFNETGSDRYVRFIDTRGVRFI